MGEHCSFTNFVFVLTLRAIMELAKYERVNNHPLVFPTDVTEV